MPDHQNASPGPHGVRGACGCVRYPDQSWGLCADCAARIGRRGTCLVCGGPADEVWIANGDTDLQGCSEGCALLAARDAEDATRA